MESRKVHTLENGGSNPPPAIRTCEKVMSYPVICWADQKGNMRKYNSVVEFHTFSMQCQGFDSSYFPYLASGLTGLIHLPAAAGQ